MNYQLCLQYSLSADHCADQNKLSTVSSSDRLNDQQIIVLIMLSCQMFHALIVLSDQLIIDLFMLSYHMFFNIFYTDLFKLIILSYQM